jgi:YggT family protein
MFAFGYLFNAAATVLDLAINLYIWILVASAVISWVNPDPFNPIVRFLHRATEPVLRPVRRWLTGKIPGAGVDVSPLVVILCLVFIQRFAVQTLYHLARRF